MADYRERLQTGVYVGFRTDSGQTERCIADALYDEMNCVVDILALIQSLDGTHCIITPSRYLGRTPQGLDFGCDGMCCMDACRPRLAAG